MTRVDENLPHGAAPLSISDRIDMTCDAFEQELLQGRRPRIETHLEALDGGSSPALLVELLRIEIEYRRRFGEDPRAEEYVARFPAHATLLRSIDFTPGANSQLLQPESDAEGMARFELLEKLGAGGFGTVWRARDTKLERIVALKLPHSGGRSVRHSATFLREAKAAARLRHPNIIAVHDFAHTGEVMFIVYEYVAGVNLGDWLRRETPSAETAAELCAKIARALHHAHGNGLVHRDLKPANVILDEAGEPHVTDFGLAKHTSANPVLLSEGCVVGTPAYMSPEQARGEESKIDPRSDVYALGAMLYELLTGTRPFQGSAEAVVEQILSSHPLAPRTKRKSTPRDLEAICLKAMAKEPADRYASAGDLAMDLERFLRGDAVQARDAVSFNRWRHWARHNPRLVAAEVLVACLVLGSLATLPRGQEQSNSPEVPTPKIVAPDANQAPPAVAAVPGEKTAPDNKTSPDARNSDAAQAANDAPIVQPGVQPIGSQPAGAPAANAPAADSSAAADSAVGFPHGFLPHGSALGGDYFIAVPDQGSFPRLHGFDLPLGIHGAGFHRHSSAYEAFHEAFHQRITTWESGLPSHFPHHGPPQPEIGGSASGADPKNP